LELGGHHNHMLMDQVLRPKVPGYASPMQFLSENRKQFQSLEPESNQQEVLSTSKNYKETSKALRVFELYNPDSVNKALRT
jgi:hypothetical protein